MSSTTTKVLVDLVKKLEEKNVKVLVNSKIKGESGIYHNFDLIIMGNKTLCIDILENLTLKKLIEILAKALDLGPFAEIYALINRKHCEKIQFNTTKFKKYTMTI
ncbi:MAG: hypothetical protein DRN04_09660 [Thermoprotei archaeon]|nr:MAG: hypothetical protein DRN04_09660 [Thermoprotei archaeon]